MTWASVGLLGNVGSTATSTSMAITTTIPAAADSLTVVTVALVNASTSSTTQSAITVTDSAGNTYVRAQEFNTSGGAATECMCGVFYTNHSVALASAQTITVTHNFAAASTRRACGAWNFSHSAGAAVTVKAVTWLGASSAASPGSIDQTVPAVEFLRFRGIASESSLTTALTTTAGWTSIGTTRGGALAMSYRGEFLITSAATAASNPTFTSTASDASVYVVFEESALMPQTVL